MGWQEFLIILFLLSSIVALVAVLATAGRHYPNSAVDSWYGEHELVTATPARRAAAYMLDLLIGTVTLGVGSLIWFIIVAPRGQTPEKSLLSLYVLRRDGTRAGGAYIWGREYFVKGLIWPWVVLFTFGIGWLGIAFWFVRDRDKQTLWDKAIGSYVAFSPGGYKPLTRGEALLVGAQLPGSGPREQAVL